METFDLFNEMVPDWALTGIAQTAHATKAQKIAFLLFADKITAGSFFHKYIILY